MKMQTKDAADDCYANAYFHESSFFFVRITVIICNILAAGRQSFFCRRVFRELHSSVKSVE